MLSDAIQKSSYINTQELHTIPIKETNFVSYTMYSMALTPQNVLALWSKTNTEKMQDLKFKISQS